MQETVIKYKAPGMILAIWVPGSGEYVKAIGLADIKTGRKLMPTDRFRIGSNTKTFVGTIVLQLVDDKKLKLDDKLSRFYPEFPNAGKITIKMLLNHTSGIFNYSTDEKFGRLLERDPDHAFRPEQLLKYALGHKPYFAPGHGFQYSNTNTVLLGLIIEKITGNTLADEVQRRIFDKLSMRDSFFPKGAEISGVYAHGYMLEKGKYKDYTNMNVSWGWAAGAIISTVNDLKTYLTALTDGTLLSGKLQKERMNDWVDISRIKEFPSIRYGYNVFNFGGFIGHNGGLPGYVSYMVRNPGNGTVLIMMLNTQPAEAAATLNVLKAVINILYPSLRV